MSTISNERLESLQRQFKEEGFNDISDSEIMKLVEENLALRKERERERAEPVVTPKPFLWYGQASMNVYGCKDGDESRIPLYTAPTVPVVVDDSLPYDPQIAKYEQMMEAEQAQADTTSQQFESLAGKAADGWIPCSERMPEHGVDVQIFCSDTKEQFVGFRCIGGNDFQYGHYEGVAIVCSPSHWQPLPEPPCK